MDKQCQQLKPNESYRILTLLQKFKDMIGGNLGTWNTSLVDLELKCNVKPVCSRPYPVPRVQKAMFKKESESLVSPRILKHVNK